MKKAVLVLALAVGLSAGAFAQHPNKLGVGAGFQYGGNWDSDRGDPGSGLSLFLKTSTLPIYWGIYANVFNWEFGDHTHFGFNVTGDYFLKHDYLVQEAGLSWFLGVGGYAGFWRSSNGFSSNLLDFGVRLPIGLSWMPVNFFEVFIDVAPSVGFYFWSGDRSTSGLGGGWQGDLGIRFWF
ncbi:MAG: DUF3996 domain-containing protein [Treponema sp.]|nr:DUF3996 domain-containing protein [Treponema sp.]